MSKKKRKKTKSDNFLVIYEVMRPPSDWGEFSLIEKRISFVKNLLKEYGGGEQMTLKNLIDNLEPFDLNKLINESTVYREPCFYTEPQT